MLAQEILHLLDNATNEAHYGFCQLGHPYSFLIDSRINVFSDTNDRWAIVVERLGYNPRQGSVNLELHTYGNCLISNKLIEHLPKFCFSIDLIENLEATSDGEDIISDAKYWLVRGEKLEINHDFNKYYHSRIFKNGERDGIGIYDVCRLMIVENSQVFRATENELHYFLPIGLEKIMVLDEWNHKDFDSQYLASNEEMDVQSVYDFNNQLVGGIGIDFHQFSDLIKSQNEKMQKALKKLKGATKPSEHEAWKLIATVLESNDVRKYKPKKQSNNHWVNWPDSGSL